MDARCGRAFIIPRSTRITAPSGFFASVYNAAESVASGVRPFIPVTAGSARAFPTTSFTGIALRLRRCTSIAAKWIESGTPLLL